MKKETINVGIGFATGRKQFLHLLKSYFLNWQESGLIGDENIKINLFVAYDLKYRGTKKADYTAIPGAISALIENTFFIGSREIAQVQYELKQYGIAGEENADLLFGKGYAAQRNIILYYAIKNNIDYLLFLDDDEYPVVVTRNKNVALWSGQHVLTKHLENIAAADITCGYHCGYISPIPAFEFTPELPEAAFQQFIGALSNDILNWENMKKVLQNGGVTYADTDILIAEEVLSEPEIQHTKFISGSNLCLNLKDPSRVFPFYNPPGARGEDTFLSTCLSQREVLRVPCYTFHDGFSAYKHLLSGVLPRQLKPVDAASESVLRRFYAACVGWIRYKPLLLYITDRGHYQERIKTTEEQLKQTLPMICDYFDTKSFMKILPELRKYAANVEKHYAAFEESKTLWAKLMEVLQDPPSSLEYQDLSH
ncbi:MAG TPA: hypothetical protein PKD52_02640 [Clostridiales bacterium]|nr:hypothetical protein [Clostridiales bacterium]